MSEATGDGARDEHCSNGRVGLVGAGRSPCDLEPSGDGVGRSHPGIIA